MNLDKLILVAKVGETPITMPQGVIIAIVILVWIAAGISRGD